MKIRFITKILALVMVLNTITISGFTPAYAASVSDYVIQEIADYDFNDTSKTSPFWKSEYKTEDGKSFISFTDSTKYSAFKTDFSLEATKILEIKYDIYTNFSEDDEIYNYSVNVAAAGGYTPVRLVYIGKKGNIVSPTAGWSTEKLDNNTWYTILIRLDIENKKMSVKYRLASDKAEYTDVHLHYYDEAGNNANGIEYPYNGGKNSSLPANIKSLTIGNKHADAKAYMDNLTVTEYSEIPSFKENIHTAAFDDGETSPTASWDKVQKITSAAPWSHNVNSDKEFVTVDMDVYSGSDGSYTVSVDGTDILVQTQGSIDNSGKYNPAIYSRTSNVWNKLRFTLDKTKGTYKSYIADGDKYFEVNDGTVDVDDSFNLSVNTTEGDMYIDDVVINDIAPISIAFNQCIDINGARSILDYAYDYGLLKFPLGYAALTDIQKDTAADLMTAVAPAGDAQALLDKTLADIMQAMSNGKLFVYDYDFTYNSNVISSLRLAASGKITSVSIDDTPHTFSSDGNIATIDGDIDLTGKKSITISARVAGAEQELVAKCGGFAADNADFNYYPGWTRKAITFSLDDCNVTQDAKALSYLNAANIKGTFNLIGSTVEKYTADELLTLYKGHEVGDHGYHHIRAIPSDANMADYELKDDGFYYKDTTPYLSVDAFKDSMDRGKSVIEAIFGEGSVKSFAWPYGRGAAGKNRDILDKAMEDYSNLRHSISLEISKSKYFSHPTDLADWLNYKEWNVSALDTDLVPKYEAYRDHPDDGKLKFFAVGMHSSDYNRNENWSAMESFCNDMGNRPELYWYATNTEIIDYGLYVKDIDRTEGYITNNSPCDLYFISDGKKSIIPANSKLKLALCFGDDMSGCNMTFSKELDTITDDKSLAGDLIHGYGEKTLSEITYTTSNGANVEIYSPDGTKITDTSIKAYPGIMYKCTSGDKKYTKTYTLGYSDICIYAPFVDIQGEGEGKTLKVNLQMRAFTPSGKTYTAYAAAYSDGEMIALNKGEVTVEGFTGYKTLGTGDFTVTAAGADSYKVIVVDKEFNPVLKNTYADNELNGKKILFLGDSITGISDAGYPMYVGSLFGAEVHNGGISGTTLAKGKGELYEYFSLANLADMLTGKITDDVKKKIDTWYASNLDAVGKRHYANTLKTVDISKMEYLSIFYSTNDFNRLTPIDNSGDEFDVLTAKGALRYALDSFKKANHNLKIVVFTPLYRDRMLNVDGMKDGKNSDYYPNSEGKTLKEYCRAIEDVCKEYDIPCYNLYELSGINRLNAKFYLSDGLHPGESGRNYLGQLIGRCIANAY